METPKRSSARARQHKRERLFVDLELGKEEKALLEKLGTPCDLTTINKVLGKVLTLQKELNNKMSAFTDALAAFQAEQATLLTNIATEIQQLADAVASGNTNATDIQAGLTALASATAAAQAANAALTADDSPVVVEGS